MKTHHLEPARTIIGKVGINAIAGATGVHVSRVYRWMYGKNKGGTGGLIPMDHIRPIMAVAANTGIALTADDFLPPMQERSREVAA